MTRTTSILMLAALLAGCQSASDKYPSLAIRDAERVQGSFEPAEDTAPPAPLPAAPELVANLEQLLSTAMTLHDGFVSAAPGAERIANAARGADQASDAWANAQVALADLDSRRSQLAVVLGDLDLIYADAALALELREEVSVTRSAVVRLVEEEDRILARLRGA